MTIGKALRYEVMRRDANRCRKCGRTAADGAKLVVDHVLAAKLGGLTVPENLETLCFDCNAGKGATPVDAPAIAGPDERAQQWMRAMAAAVKLRYEDAFDLNVALADFEEAWDEWRFDGSDGESKLVPKPEDWDTRIESYLRRGVPITELVPLIRVAMTARIVTTGEYPRWRYYVGCAKNLLADLERRARGLMDAQDDVTASGTETPPVTEPPIRRVDPATIRPSLDDL